MQNFTPQFETWWNEIGTKVCRLKPDWARQEAKIVASIAFADGKNARREESKAVTEKQETQTPKVKAGLTDAQIAMIAAS